MKPRLIKFRYFFWLIVPLALWLAYQAFGLPHMIWSYSSIDQGQGMNPLAQRYYTQCRFVGPYGQFDFFPSNGRCRWVRLIKQGSDQ